MAYKNNLANSMASMHITKQAQTDGQLDDWEAITNPPAHCKFRRQRRDLWITNEQEQIIDLVRHLKQSVFFTGVARGGKTWMLQNIVEILRCDLGHEAVGVVGPTKRAAADIEGTELYDLVYSGDPFATSPRELVAAMDSAIMQRWRNMQVLVIDEISMISAEDFDRTEAIARLIKGNGRIFGGIQLVVSGDFLSVSPERGEANFAFDANTWNTAIPHAIKMQSHWRPSQRIAMLSQVRIGKMINALATLNGPRYEGSVEILPTSVRARSVNDALLCYPSDKRLFFSKDRGWLASLDKYTVPWQVELTLGSKVVLTKDINSWLVTGTYGEIVMWRTSKAFKQQCDVATPVELMDEEVEYPVVEFDVPHEPRTIKVLVGPMRHKFLDEPDETYRDQLPLTSIAATGVEETHGQVLQNVTVNMEEVWHDGEVYAALSRGGHTIRIKNFREAAVQVNERALRFENTLLTVGQVISSLKGSSIEQER